MLIWDNSFPLFEKKLSKENEKNQYQTLLLIKNHPQIRFTFRSGIGDAGKKEATRISLLQLYCFKSQVETIEKRKCFISSNHKHLLLHLVHVH
ncbi:hypothetical protein ABD71_18170 [Brevibacillus laterosporus]|nr:hypothetical protein [Brevibacillus laterosporus]